jgi:hypothetical protein
MLRSTVTVRVVVLEVDSVVVTTLVVLSIAGQAWPMVQVIVAGGVTVSTFVVVVKLLASSRVPETAELVSRGGRSVALQDKTETKVMEVEMVAEFIVPSSSIMRATVVV